MRLTSKILAAALIAAGILIAAPAAKASPCFLVAVGGTGNCSFGQGWIYTNGTTSPLGASSSPTVGYLTATSSGTSTLPNEQGNTISLTSATSSIRYAAGFSNALLAGNGWAIESGNYAYATSHSATGTLTVADITNPESPKLVGQLSNLCGYDTAFANGCEGLAKVGNTVFVAGYGDNSILAVNVQNPSSPALVGTLTDNTYLPAVEAVHYFGGYLFAVAEDDLPSGSPYITAIDASNPASMRVVSHVTNAHMEFPVDIVVDPTTGYGYVLDESSTYLNVVNLNAPTNLAIVSSTSVFPSGATVGGVIKGKYLYVGGDGSIYVVDISNPLSPKLVNTVTGGGVAEALEGNYLYDTSFGNYIDAYSLAPTPATPSASSTNPVQVMKMTNAAFQSTDDISLYGNYAYVTDDDSSTLSILYVGGVTTPSIYAGTIQAVKEDVDDLLNVGREVVQYGLSVGTGGIVNQGSIISSSTVSKNYSSSTDVYDSGIATATGAFVAVAPNGHLIATTSPGGTGTLTSIATNNGLTGGPITTSGTIGLNITSLLNNYPVTWNGSNLAATGTVAFTAPYFNATNTNATSTFYGGVAFASTTSTTTAKDGFNISAGCFAKNGVCVTGSGGIGGSISSGQIAFGSGSNTIQGTANATLDTSGDITAAGYVSAGTYLQASGNDSGGGSIDSPSWADGTGSGMAIDYYGNFVLGSGFGSGNGWVVKTTSGTLTQYPLYISGGGCSTGVATLCLDAASNGVYTEYNTVDDGSANASFYGTLNSYGTLNQVGPLTAYNWADITTSATDVNGAVLGLTNTSGDVYQTLTSGNGNIAYIYQRNGTGALAGFTGVNGFSVDEYGGSNSVGQFLNNGNVYLGGTITSPTLHTGAFAADLAATSSFDIGSTTAAISTLFVQGSASRPTEDALDVASSSGNQYLSVKSSGNVGVGSTSPGSLLSVGSANGIDLSTGTSTFYSTGGINLTGGCFALSGTCLSASSGGSPYPFTPTSNYGSTNQATTGIPWFENGLNASSTSNLVNASSTNLTVSGTGFFGNGSVTLPSISFNAQDNLGIYRGGADELDFTSVGTQRLKIVGNAMTFLNTTPTGANNGDFMLEVNTTPATSTPAYSFGGDSGTGIWDPGTSHRLALVVNGVEALRVDRDGYVGVGTSTPGDLLSVQGGSILDADVVQATSTAMNVPFASSTSQTINIGTSAMSIYLTGYQAGGVLRLTVCNPSTGSGGAVTFSASTTLHWSGGAMPTQTTAANECDLWVFTVTSGSSTPFIWGSQEPW